MRHFTTRWGNFATPSTHSNPSGLDRVVVKSPNLGVKSGALHALYTGVYNDSTWNPVYNGSGRASWHKNAYVLADSITSVLVAQE